MARANGNPLMDLAYWSAAACAIAYALLHLLIVAALVTFGERAGGYPLQALAIATYGLLVVAGVVLALWQSARRSTPSGKLLPLLALATLLSVVLAGAFLATQSLGWMGLRAEYAPYHSDDGAFALVNAMLAAWVIALALAVRWRGLLVAGMAAQGLALLFNPGLLLVVLIYLPVALRQGLPTDWYALLAVPVLYAAATLALGWLPRMRWRVIAGLFVVAVVAVSVLGLGSTTIAAFATLLGLPLGAWRLRGWAATGETPGRLATAGVGLALLAGLPGLFLPYLGPGSSLGDNYLPMPGKYMGWIGKTVPPEAYGPAGDALLALRDAYPWLLGAATLVWLGAVARWAQQMGLRVALRRLSLPGGLAALGFGMLWQSPLPYSFALPARGMALALPASLGEPALAGGLAFGCSTLGLGLLGLGAALRDASGRRGVWLAFAAATLALLSAAILTAGIPAGVAQGMELQRLITLAEYRQSAQLRLALSLPLNAGLALLAWGVVIAAGRRLAVLPRPALGRAAALVVGAGVLLAVAGWQVTGMPVVETSPPDSALGVPTNAAIAVRLAEGKRNWSPGVSAYYEDSGEYIPGSTGGSVGGEVWFVPQVGWRPNARVLVKVGGPSLTRYFRFSFTTGNGPVADVPSPPSPGPKPTPSLLLPPDGSRQ